MVRIIFVQNHLATDVIETCLLPQNPVQRCHVFQIHFQATPVYWPTTKDMPSTLQQLTLTLLKEEEVEKGILNMAEFEVVFHEMASTTGLYDTYMDLSVLLNHLVDGTPLPSVSVSQNRNILCM